MTPAEQHAQRMKALADANKVRVYRADVKRDIATGIMDPRVPLRRPDGLLDGMLVVDYLLAVPGLGRTRLRKAQQAARFDPQHTTLGSLTTTQRNWLVLWLGAYMERADRYRQTLMARQRRALA